MGVGKFLRNCGYKAIDNVIPRDSTIALMSTGAGWYGSRYSKTYAPGFLVDFFQGGVDTQSKKLCSYAFCDPANRLFSHFAAPIWVPDASDKIEAAMGTMVGIVTCVTLNIFASFVYGPLDEDKDQSKEKKLAKKNLPSTPFPPSETEVPQQKPIKKEDLSLAKLEIRVDVPPPPYYHEVYCHTESC